jgi:hypothetical protein
VRLKRLKRLKSPQRLRQAQLPYYTKRENALARRERPGDEINEINEISYLSRATLGWLYSKGERGALPSVPGDW